MAICETQDSESEIWLLHSENGDSQRKPDEPSDEGIGLFAAFVFTVNMVIGAGIVGLPFAFFHSGALFGLVCLFGATVMAGTTMGYILEVAGWCEGWVTANEAHERGAPSDSMLGMARPEWFTISSRRKFELSEMCSVFLGVPVPTWLPWLRNLADERGELQFPRRILEIAILCSSFGTCWLYATVFASTMSLIAPLPFGPLPLHPVGVCLSSHCARHHPTACSSPCVLDTSGQCAADAATTAFCHTNYIAFLCIFAAVMLVASCASLQWLKRFQVIAIKPRSCTHTHERWPDVTDAHSAAKKRMRDANLLQERWLEPPPDGKAFAVGTERADS
jgi:hypothetical protein